jgi:hypothetical protein
MARNLGLYTDIAAAQVTDVEEEGCPTCGRPPVMEIVAQARRPERHWWLACALLAIAGYLAIVFGPPTWGDVQDMRDARAWLSGTEGLAEGVFVDPDSYVSRHVRESQTPWEMYVVARGRLNRDLGALAVGVLAAALGLGAVLRGIWVPTTGRRLGGVGAQTPSSGNWLETTLAAVWTLADALGVSVMRVLLLIFCYRAATGLLEGEPPSGSFVTDTTNRTLDLLVSAIRSLQ